MKDVVIVTGANGGIGHLACERFMDLGYTVVGVDLHFDEEKAYETICVDLTNADQVEQMVHQVYDTYGNIAAVFNIAGGSGRRFGDGPLDQCSIEGFDKTLEMNLKTQFLVNKNILPIMMKQDHGCIINVASVLGMYGGGEHFATHSYAAAKGAIISMSKAMASYYAKYHIRVNVVAPGLIKTPMSKRAQTNAEVLEYVKGKQIIYADKDMPLGDPMSIVKAAELFLQDDFMTGVVLPVDGGWCAI